MYNCLLFLENFTAMSDVELAFSRLRDALSGRELPFLSPSYYAEAHALFESCSNQRSLIVNWLSQWILDHFSKPSSLDILSIGCGDGSADVQVAKYLVRCCKKKSLLRNRKRVF